MFICKLCYIEWYLVQASDDLDEIFPINKLHLDVVSFKYFFSPLNHFKCFRSEGYYLHRLLSNVFEEQHKLGFLLIFGWGKSI